MRKKDQAKILPYDNGGRIRVHQGDYLQDILMRDGFYEKEVWDALAERAEPDDVFWDVGANIGSVAIRAMRDSRISQVHCFEPHPQIRSELEANVALNGGRASIHGFALGDVAETRRVYTGPAANRGRTNFSFDWREGTVDVQCCTADGVVAAGVAPAPTLLKIDVEDWEHKVLLGARRLLTDSPPKAIVFEDPPCGDGVPVQSPLAQYLRAFGYAVTPLRRQGGEILERENFLAVFALPKIRV